MAVGGPVSRQMDRDFVASVNGVPISQRDLERAAQLAHIEQSALRPKLLGYLIDQELIVQHAVEIGLVVDDPELRRLVVRRTMDAATRNSDKEDATAADDWIRIASSSVRAIEREQCRISGVRRDTPGDSYQTETVGSGVGGSDCHAF
jgi:SurA N-terminal domain